MSFTRNERLQYLIIVRGRMSVYEAIVYKISVWAMFA